MLSNAKLSLFYIFLVGLALFESNVVQGRRKYSRQDLLKLREEVREMFNHAYSGYLNYAYPYDELRPLTCDGIDTWGSYSLTLIDALDTLAVMGNFTEFRRVVNIVTAKANFDANINVSVFETNIRIVGGLLSAHLLSQRAGLELEPGWPCNGPLLRLAEDVARRLLPAFATKSGMPYGTVNLRYGVPQGETSVTCTAGVGTFILEFGALSRLTGDPVYEEVAMHALKAMYDHRSPIGLFGNHIDVKTGKWVARDSGIGAGVDSFFEYLVKGSILLNRPELMAMFNEARKPIDKYLKKNNWYIWASMHKGQVTLPVFQSLEAYWPGVLTLIGDIETALRSMHNYNSVWKQYGFTPEFYNIPQGQAGTNRESYPLRPELVESAMYLYRATGDPFMLDIGKNILRSIQHSAKTQCGYATIKDARDHTQENRMESFFLAETTKYLYLLFDPENFIHNRGSHGRLHTLSSGKQCVLDSGAYIFNTEAHPIDASALHCCHDWKQESFNPYSTFNYKGEMVSEAIQKQHHESDGEEEIFIDTGTGYDELTKAPGHQAHSSNRSPRGDEAKKMNSEGSERVTKDVEIDDAEGSVVVNDGTEGGRVVKGIVEVLSMEDAMIDSDEPMESKDTTNTTIQNRSVHEAQVDELLKLVEGNRKNLLALIEKWGQTGKEEDSQHKDSNNTIEQSFLQKDDEPTFSPNQEPQIENTSFDMNEGIDGSIVTKNRVGEKLSDAQDDKTDLISFTDYVKTLVISPPPSKTKFDVQALLENVRHASHLRPHNRSWDNRYDFLTCKAQPFLIRITIAGEFMDEKFHDDSD